MLRRHAAHNLGAGAGAGTPLSLNSPGTPLAYCIRGQANRAIGTWCGPDALEPNNVVRAVTTLILGNQPLRSRLCAAWATLPAELPSSVHTHQSLTCCFTCCKPLKLHATVRLDYQQLISCSRAMPTALPLSQGVPHVSLAFQHPQVAAQRQTPAETLFVEILLVWHLHE